MPSSVRIPSRRVVVAVLAALTGTATIGLGALPAGADTATSNPSVHRCSSSQLATRVEAGQGGLGHLGFPIEYTNTSHATCSLTGYPGVDALAKNGHVLAHARRTTSGYLAGAPAVRTVTIEPGRHASAFVEWVDMTGHGSQCRQSQSIAETAPNTTRSLHLDVRVQTCDLQVHPVVPGATGSKTRHSHYSIARSDWITSAKVAAAKQAEYLRRAADELQRAQHDHTTAVRQLRQLAAIPETDTTRAQQHAARHLVGALDRFFHTPKLYR